MDIPIQSREEVADRLAVSTRLLLRYEARGLVRAVRWEQVEGYGPAEIRRLGSIVSLQRDLGINLAGVEAVLRMRSQFDRMQAALAWLAEELHDAIEETDADEVEHEA